MGRHLLVAILLVSVAFSAHSIATEGRAAPQCAEFDLSDVTSSILGVGVDPGACLIVNLGERNSQTTLSFDIEIMDDEMDILMFDQNGILVYKNGQNYRTAFVTEGSFESFIGDVWFDWTTPLSGSDKTWYLVFDNSAHDGDGGLGDQGGSTSKFLIDVSVPEESTYPLIHDTYFVEVGQRLNIANFAVDANSELNYWVHPISGDGEFFIQSNNQLNGDLIIAGTRFSQLVDDINYESWVIPEYLDLQNINLMVDAGNSGFHFTIEASFEPVLSPVVMDYVNGSTTIGESIILDASESPNSLDQISSLSWDFNSDQVIDEQGFIVEAMWNSPGLKTINATAESSTGEIMIVTHQIMVNDDTNPIAVISGEGTKGIDGEWRLLRLSDLTLRSANSYDDHQIATTSWHVDGILLGSNPDLTVSWSDIGTYNVKLTVTDPTGNSNYTENVIVVYDSTIPALEMSEIEASSNVYRGESVKFTANAVDLWDDESNLTFAWDLDLEKDSNGDGDARNDADKVGKSIEVSFSETGQHKIGLTVYDASNNTDFEVFTVQVNPEPSSANLFAIVAVIFFVILVVSGVVLFGYRSAQKRHAIEILMNNNFTYEQASARINNIMKTTKLPTFAKAEQLAGIVEGGQLKTPAQLETEAKAAEIAQIYGNDSITPDDPYAGFKPQYQQSAPVGQFADEALAAFADEPSKTPKPAPKSPIGKVRSGGVSLPTSPPQANQYQEQTQISEPKNHNLVGDCSSCGQKFSVNMPQGVNSAVVACPSCGSDQLFER